MSGFLCNFWFPDNILCYLKTKCAEKHIFASQHQLLHKTLIYLQGLYQKGYLLKVLEVCNCF